MSAAPLFPPDAVVRRVDGELVLLLGGGRALLMQLAHPLVARGVAEHSDFRRDRDVPYPRVPWPLALPAAMGRRLTTGLLPAPLRRVA